MKKELPKAYLPQEIEDKIYKKWEKSGFFNPDVCVAKGVTDKKAEAFSMVLPPPNVTGTLHLGHAAMLAIEDLIARYHRLKGDKTLWIPGTDHAAIATQSKVEKILWEKEKKIKYDLGRTEFLKEVNKFAAHSHDTIIKQAKKMGSSLDWSREVYTLDDERTIAVRTAFKKMFDDGLIYKGFRLINWDPKMQTTVSDDEVERQEEKTNFYYLQYGPFVIGTARPETKFGDKYIVVHPDDERYKEFKHGQKIELEWINGIVVATVIKDKAIDMNFGTGAMTITPWHDAVDFDIAARHKLEKEQIIDFNGKMLPIAGEFEGMDIKQARQAVIRKLSEKGLVVKTDENYLHSAAYNSRGGGLIEPQVKEQWFIAVNKEFFRNGKMTTLKKIMKQAVRSGKVEIIPERFNKTYFRWIDNLRDWCISRQIWFGHQIPVWYKGKKIYTGVNAPKGKDWIQDSDTLDTWFSSGLWTFSSLGWPKKTKELKLFHPISVMETGYDIIFFWVARMILMSGYLMDDIPFKKVYLHGLVRDEKGKKMSKSLGNVINPLDVCEKYGTDAVRLALVIGSTPGNDMKMSEEKIAGFKNFVNKLWNISRYVLTNFEYRVNNFELDSKGLTVADEWILKKMKDLISGVNLDIENFNFSQAGEKLQDFTWNDFADWYLEISKFEKNGAKNQILIKILEDLLVLWHPFMPFVTEAIWQEMNKGNLLMVEKWPSQISSVWTSDSKSSEFELIKKIIISIRNARAENKIEPAKKIKAVIYAGNKMELIESQSELIKSLKTGIGEVKILEKGPEIKDEIKITVDGIKIFLIGAIDKEMEKNRLRKRLSELENVIKNLESRLANEQFTANAPEKIVQIERDKLSEFKKEESSLKNQLENL